MNGKIWENGIETCKISCMKRVASPDSMHDTGCLGLVHWDYPEGWYGEGQTYTEKCFLTKWQWTCCPSSLSGNDRRQRFDKGRDSPFGSRSPGIP